MANNRISATGLIDTAQQSSTYIHDFYVKKNSHSLFCFFEGYDHMYYYDKIRYITNDDLVVIKCGNKKKTIDAFNRLYHKCQGNTKMAFFVDRDFDELINEPAIFETDGYSIENYYCSWDVFCRIVEYGFRVNKELEDWNGLKDFYDKSINEFHEVVGDFNAFYSLLRKYDKEHQCQHNCHLGCTFDSSLGTIKVGGFNKKYTMNDLFEKYTGGQMLFDESNVRNELDRLISHGASKSFRGKYELEFLCVILRFLINDSNTNKQIIKNKSIKDNISQDTIMGTYCQYAEYPDRLKEYIQSSYNR